MSANVPEILMCSVLSCTLSAPAFFVKNHVAMIATTAVSRQGIRIERILLDFVIISTSFSDSFLIVVQYRKFFLLYYYVVL